MNAGAGEWGGYRVLVEHELVLWCRVGRVTGEELIADAVQLASTPGFSPRFDELADLRGIVPEVSPDEVRRLAAVNPFGDGSRRVVLVKQDVVFGLSRMYKGLLEGDERQVLVTRSREEAFAMMDATEGSPRRLAIERFIT